MKPGLGILWCTGVLLIAPTSRGDQPGPVSDAMLTLGMSMNSREGLHPTHKSDADYGLRIDGRFFLDLLVDDPILGGFGVGGHFNQVFDLHYGMPTGDSWDASQIQWQAEIIYRLSIEKLFLKPTFLLRTGYGSTSCIIDTDHSLALSASYGYPFTALDVHLMILDPYIRMHASAGYLFALIMGEDVDGSGWGYFVRAGMDFAILGQFLVGLGYERLQFSFDDQASGETTDCYQGFLFRAGWGFR